jgi:hypothetical protein
MSNTLIHFGEPIALLAGLAFGAAVVGWFRGETIALLKERVDALEHEADDLADRLNAATRPALRSVSQPGGAL